MRSLRWNDSIKLRLIPPAELMLFFRADLRGLDWPPTVSLITLAWALPVDFARESSF
jgi:hypothetical protein